MSNVTFTQQIYTREVLQSFIKTLAPLSTFSIDASPAPSEVGTVVKVSLVTGAGITIDSVETDFEPDGGTLTEIPVTLGTYKKTGMAVTDRQQVESIGASLLQLNNAYQVGNALASNVLTDVFSALVPATFTNTAYTTAARDVFDYNDVALLLAASSNLKFPKHGLSLVLGPTQFYSLARSLPWTVVGGQEAISDGDIKGVFGLYSIYLSNVLPANCVGFLAARQALAVAFRHIPAPYPQEYISTDVATDETGLTVGYRRHYARKTRKTFDVWDTLYGYQVADPEALIFISNHA